MPCSIPGFLKDRLVTIRSRAQLAFGALSLQPPLLSCPRVGVARCEVSRVLECNTLDTSQILAQYAAQESTTALPAWLAPGMQRLGLFSRHMAASAAAESLVAYRHLPRPTPLGH